MKTTTLILMTILLTLSACTPQAAPTLAPTLTVRPPLPVEQTRPAVPSAKSDGNTYTVINPTSGANLYVEVLLPASGTGPFPALVLVPGGIGDGGSMRNKATPLTDAGFIAILFDADGRGQSSGSEDYNGYIQQDGLSAVIEFAATLPDVDKNAIGVATFSYGVTMGTGALARHPELPVKFLIDWEGPVNRQYTTTGCGKSVEAQHIPFAPCDDEGFWGQREALTFILQAEVPYQRIQSQKDHVQKDNRHALEIVNAAVAAGLPWVRLNDYPTNQTYDLANPPAMLPEAEDKQIMARVAQYAAELLTLKP